MSVICFGGVCIPVTAIFPVILLALRPLWLYISRWILWFQGKPAVSTEPQEPVIPKVETTSENYLTLTDEAQWTSLMKAESRPVVAYFTGSWCKPCKATTPHVKKLSEDHRDIVFVTVDATKFADIHIDQGVVALPTLKTYKYGVAQGSVVGSDMDAMTSIVANLAGAS